MTAVIVGGGGAGTAVAGLRLKAVRGGGFQVHLDNFDGPFDLLLQLISRHKLDITEVALSQVTDEFIAHIKAAGSAWDLDQTSHFVVVAATLLDLKAARLIPSGEVEDPEDLALLEARDLLFARLLQYRAFQRVASYIATTLRRERRFPRDVGIEPRFARLLPEVTMAISPPVWRRWPRRRWRRSRPACCRWPTCTPRSSAFASRPRWSSIGYGTSGHHDLSGADRDSSTMLTTVARFLALLELFRDGAVAFEQLTPLGELTVRWTGSEDDDWHDLRRIRATDRCARGG